MQRFTIFKLAPAALLVLAQGANALTQPVTLNVLDASTTLSTPFAAGDVLRLNTLVTTQTGPLTQEITFTAGAGVGAFDGEAAWEVSTATGTGPRLVGVNIDLLDAGNMVVASDNFQSVVAGFALSTIAGALNPGGIYTLRATGTGVRDSSLDVTLAFAVPEPSVYLLMLAGLGVLGVVAARRRRR